MLFPARQGVGGEALARAEQRGQGIQHVELKGACLGALSWPSACPHSEKIVRRHTRINKCPPSLCLPSEWSSTEIMRQGEKELIHNPPPCSLKIAVKRLCLLGIGTLVTHKLVC